MSQAALRASSAVVCWGRGRVLLHDVMLQPLSWSDLCDVRGQRASAPSPILGLAGVGPLQLNGRPPERLHACGLRKPTTNKL